jgi:putative oxidoreductase
MDSKVRAYWPIPLRILLGASFLFHGLPKLVGGHAGFMAMLQAIGVPAPGFFAWVVSLVEVFGGVALIIGAFVPIATTLLIIDMLVAMVKVHLPNGFNFVNVVGTTPQGPVFGLPGAEVNLLYIAALLALLIGGPGPLSVDERVAARDRSRKAPWGKTREAHT